MIILEVFSENTDYVGEFLLLFGEKNCKHFERIYSLNCKNVLLFIHEPVIIGPLK